MYRYIIKRILMLIPVFAGSFIRHLFYPRADAGDPAELVAGVTPPRSRSK
jgi:ABC-type dipeptide/oligopeptide/nickel transport system permease component